MISIQVFEKMRKALPQTRLMVSAGELLIVDQNAEILGQVNFKGKGVTVNQDYTHWRKVVRRLRKEKLSVEVNNLNDMETATKIIYE